MTAQRSLFAADCPADEPAALLAHLHSRGVRLWVERSGLRWSARTGTTTIRDVLAIKRHETSLVALLAGGETAGDPVRRATLPEIAG